MVCGTPGQLTIVASQITITDIMIMRNKNIGRIIKM
jgi:hypothetical protein